MIPKPFFTIQSLKSVVINRHPTKDLAKEFILMKTIKKKPQILRYHEAPKVVARLNVGMIHAKRLSFVGFVFLSYIPFVILESRGDHFLQWNG